MRFTAFLALLIVVNNAYSQYPDRQNSTKVELSGNVVDGDTGSALEFATISLFSDIDSSLIDGTLSDNQGKFALNVSPGNYYLKLEFISYQSKMIDLEPISPGESSISIGEFSLRQESTLLDDVEIVADRSETVFALDKRIFTVGKDLANRGGSAEDILDNVPSVTVDIEGNVSLRGSSGVRILIDGRPSGLVGVGNTNGLRSIAANMIEKVEVITNPSARYEAEGMAGIINIILKKNETHGFNGSFDLNSGYPTRAGASANLNYRKNNINWFVNYGLNYNESPGGGFAIQDQLSYDELSMTEQRQFTSTDRENDRTGLNNSIRFGLDYFITDKDQLTGSFLLRKSDEDNLYRLRFDDYIAGVNDFGFDPLWENDLDDLIPLNIRDFSETLDNDLLYNSINRTDTEFENEKNLEYQLNYRKEFSSRDHNFNASLQYREKSEDEGSELLSSYQDDLPGALEDLKQSSLNSESDHTWLFQMDYVHPISKDHKWEAGLRSSFKQIVNDYKVEEEIDGVFQPLSEFTNNFIYDEDIHAAYGIYGNTIKKFSYQFGLRVEHSTINTQLLDSETPENKREYFNIFPSGFLNYNFSESNAVQASYSRRINRPGFWSLNPFFTFSDNRNFFSGNPNADPELTDSYEIGHINYLDELTISSSLFYRHTDASLQRVQVVNKSDITTNRLPINIGTVDDYGLDISINYSGIKWLRIDGNWNIFRNQLSLDQADTDNKLYDYYTSVRNYQGTQDDFKDQYDYELRETDNVTWNGRITFRLTVWDSDIQIRTNYRGARETSQGSSLGVGSVDLGFSKDFLKAKNLTLTLSARDIFNSRRHNGLVLLDDFFRKSDFQWRARTVRLSASYRINQKKKRGGDNRSNGDFEGGGGEQF